MAKQVTIILDDEILAFVDQWATALGTEASRSSIINAVLLEARKRHLQSDLETAYRKDAKDVTYQEEIAVWGVVVGDGIDAER